MLKTLLNLWWIQKRRTFDWKRMGWFLYILLIIASGIIGGYMQMRKDGNLDMHNEVTQKLAIPMVMTFSFLGILMKLLMKQEAAGMDDYIKSRPILESSWNKFLIIMNLADYWNWVIPVLLFGISCFMMPIGYAFLTFLLASCVSITDGLMLTCLRKAQGWEYKLPLFVGLLIFYIVAAVFYVVTVVINLETIAIIGMMIITLLFLLVLYKYMCSIKHYNEQKSHTSKVHSLGDISLFSMEYISVFRSKRLRQAMIFIPIIFLFQVYTQALTLKSNDGIGAGGVSIFVMFAMAFPSMLLGQWVFGVEGNFFHGIMTKPLSIYDLLCKKYYFLMLINLVMIIPYIPGLFLGYWGFDLLVATFFFCASVNIIMMPTCLFSKRIDLFSSAFFNYQGANMAINLYGFVILIPMGIYGALMLCLNNTYIAEAIVASLGIIALLLHRVVLKSLAKRFMSIRYKRMETFCE
ncbi:MAG: hypothetical protein KBF13_06005 [Prevotella sp.]|nr:hypothetical protein [Prevotella sp.]